MFIPKNLLLKPDSLGPLYLTAACEQRCCTADGNSRTFRRCTDTHTDKKQSQVIVKWTTLASSASLSN